MTIHTSAVFRARSRRRSRITALAAGFAPFAHLVLLANWTAPPLALLFLFSSFSVARSPWFWLALVPQVPRLTWPYTEAVRLRAFKGAFTLCVPVVTVADTAVRHGWAEGRRGPVDSAGTTAVTSF